MNRAIVFVAALCMLLSSCSGISRVSGRVTAEGRPLEGVCVSDGTRIVMTDARGRYVMRTDKKDSIVFITTPSGYVAEPLDGIRPGFWQLLDKGKGRSERHDFKLVPQDQSSYSVVFITDLHFANDPSRNDLQTYERTIKPLVASEVAAASANGPVYSFNMGDFSHDRYWYDFGFNEADAERFLESTSYPTMIYSVSGNHDNDGAVAHLGDDNDFASAWCYRHTWGPDRYAVNIGRDHWVVMDNVIYINDGEADAKHVNINGKRNYRCRFSDSQLSWLEQDLASVPDTARVMLVCHVPLINDASKTERVEQSQLDTLDAIFSRFDQVTVFSGHTHKKINPDCSAAPRFKQYICPATSGSMWQNPDGTPCLGSDGSDHGITVMDCSADILKPEYVTAAHGRKVMRVYDMNAVSQYFSTDAGCRRLHELCPDRLWYGSREFKNWVMVNYWDYKPGETVEMLENGRTTVMARLSYDDPLWEITYLTSGLEQSTKPGKSLSKVSKNPHLFGAMALTSVSPVVVRVRDAQGSVVYEEVVVRPKMFGRNAE